MNLQAVLQRLQARNNRFLISAFAFYLLMLLLACIRPLERSLISMFNDKLLHVLAYMVITALIYRGLYLQFFIERLLATLAMVGSLGALDELLQLGSSHRVADFEDWLYDMLGAVFVLAILLAYHTATRFYRGQSEDHLQ